MHQWRSGMITKMEKHVEFDIDSQLEYDKRKWKPASDARRVIMAMLYSMVKDEDVKPGDSITADLRIKVDHVTNSST
jgi:hypothetical protein